MYLINSITIAVSTVSFNKEIIGKIVLDVISTSVVYKQAVFSIKQNEVTSEDISICEED